mmetsp:Transcript_51192/g.115079  ORF Transcript_51192/g.115079 Transcript_51192/m.115079 type:complete len:221 (+) Transcript_51192:908-1570(+)
MMGLQFILSMNSHRSFFTALSWPVRSRPSPFFFPLKSLSRMGSTFGLVSSSSFGVILSRGMHTCATRASNVLRLLILAISSTSASEKGMMGLMPLVEPRDLRVKASSLGMGPELMQVPQPVPALVHFLIAAKVSAPPAMAFLITPFGTEWQLHTRSSSARLVPSPPSSTLGVLPAMTSSAVKPPRSGRLVMAESLANSSVVPTRMPPSNLLPSGVKTSFL